MRMTARPHCRATTIFTALAMIVTISSAVAAQDVLTSDNHAPDLRATQKAALKRAGLQESVDKWRSRARWSNLVPYLDAETSWLEQSDSELRYQEDYEADDSGTLLPHDSRNRQIDDKRFRQAYGIQLEWDLGGLVFDRQEIYILREQRQRQSARTDLLIKVTDLYLMRERAIDELARASSKQHRRKLQHEKRRATAILDGLTDGWFSKQLDRPSSN